MAVPASAWPQIDNLPEEGLKEAKRLNNSVQLDYRKLVSINTHDDRTQKHPSLVYLQVRKQAILNHNKRETAATAKAPEEEPKEQADDQEEEEEEQQQQQQQQQEEEEEEEKKKIIKKKRKNHSHIWRTHHNHTSPIAPPEITLMPIMR